VDPAHDNRRHARRITFPCEARAYGLGELLFHSHLTDLSVTGAFLETLTEMPLGTVVILRLKAHGVELKLEAEVARCHPGRGIGVRFVDLAPSQSAAVERLIAETSASGEAG
jgi:hypothetical protein